MLITWDFLLKMINLKANSSMIKFILPRPNFAYQRLCSFVLLINLLSLVKILRPKLRCLLCFIYQVCVHIHPYAKTSTLEVSISTIHENKILQFYILPSVFCCKKSYGLSSIQKKKREREKKRKKDSPWSHFNEGIFKGVSIFHLPNKCAQTWLMNHDLFFSLDPNFDLARYEL